MMITLRAKDIFKKIEKDFVIILKINSDKHTSIQDNVYRS
jgi:hypothetical protein